MELTLKELAVLNLLYIYSISLNDIKEDLLIDDAVFQQLENKNYILIKENNELIFTVKTFDFFKVRNDISETSLLRRAKILTPELRKLFPDGKKENLYWKGSIIEIEKKLVSFLRKHKKYNNTEIINATKNYVDSFTIKTYMQVLKYFIEKDGGSTLLEYLENRNETKSDMLIKRI